MNVSYPLLWFRAAASLLWGCPCPGLPDVPVVPQPYPQALTICRLCCWCTLASSSAWRFCCLRSCACSVAGSRQPSSRATRFFSLSHMATWAYRENRALLPRAPPSPLISGLPQGRVASFWGNSFYPPQPLPTPTGGEPHENPAGKSAAAGAPPAGDDGSRLAPGVPLSCQKEGLMGPQVHLPGPGAATGMHLCAWVSFQPRKPFWGISPP